MKFDNAIKQVPGFEQFSHDDFPAMLAINDSIWNCSKEKHDRLDALGKLYLQVLMVLKPSSDDKEPGQCSHSGCPRNCREYRGSAFQFDHVNRSTKVNDPNRLARRGPKERLMNELESGLDSVCGLHHDGLKERRGFEVDNSKWIKLIPRPAQARGGGKNFLNELRENKSLRLKFSFIIIEHYVRGWSTVSAEKVGNFDTLRIVVEAYFGVLADDYIIPTANQWNDGIAACQYFRSLISYIIQDVSGTCAAATAAGTKDATRKSPEDWNESDYACKKGDYDLKNMSVLERQGIEGDHDKSSSKEKEIAQTGNVLNRIDEACHAPYHCYFCHKRRTANQNKKNGRSNAIRDYTA